MFIIKCISENKSSSFLILSQSVSNKPQLFSIHFHTKTAALSVKWKQVFKNLVGFGAFFPPFFFFVFWRFIMWLNPKYENIALAKQTYQQKNTYLCFKLT